VGDWGNGELRLQWDFLEGGLGNSGQGVELRCEETYWKVTVWKVNVTKGLLTYLLTYLLHKAQSFLRN